MAKVKVTITTEDSEVLDTFFVTSDAFSSSDVGLADFARDVRECVENVYDCTDDE